MAYQFAVNQQPASGPKAIWILISTLVLAGWVIKADSDGTTYAAAGGQLNSGATGARGLGNNLAWVRLQAPAIAGKSRELTFQRLTSNTLWRIKYSAYAGFTAGATATQTPSAADEVFLLGAGTDAAPSSSSPFFNSNDGYSYYHVACGGAAEKYSFYAFAIDCGDDGGTTARGMFMDVMGDSSYPDADIDPCVTCVVASSFMGANTWSNTSIDQTTDPAGPQAWLGATSQQRGTKIGNWVRVTLGLPYLTQAGSAGPNPWTGTDDIIPAWWFRSASLVPPYGLKGSSTLFSWGSQKRKVMSTASINSTRDKVLFTDGATCVLWAPWNGSIPLI